MQGERRGIISDGRCAMNGRTWREPRKPCALAAWVALLGLLNLTACGTLEAGIERTAPAETNLATRPITPEAATITSSPTTDTPTPAPLSPRTPPPTSYPIPEEVTLQVVGQIGGQALAVAVEGSIAYLGVGPRLVTLDVSASDTPQPLGQSDVLPGVVRDVAVVEGMAYVAAGDAGLRVLDVSDPTRPYEIGSAPTAREAQVVSVQDRMAYIAESECEGGDCRGSLRAIDISTPSDPQAIGFLEMPSSVNNVVVAENYVYIAHNKGLQVVDVSDPARPHAVSAFTRRGMVEDIAIAGGYAYVINGPQVLVMDLSSPADPQEIGSSNMMFSPYVAVAAGDNLYVSDGFCEFGQCGSQLRALDVSDSDLGELRETGSLDLADLAVDVVVADGLAYVVTWESGLNIVDLVDPANPHTVGTFVTPGSIQNVTVSGEYAYGTGGGENGLLVLDVTDPTAPQTVGVLPTLPFAGAVALAEGHAYVPAWVEGLRVVDATDPANPREVGSLDSSILQGTAGRVALGDTPSASSGQAYAYLTVQEGGLMTLDIADPVDPYPVGAYTPPAGSIRDVAVSDGHAYATGSTSEGDQRKGILYVIDVADPTRPSKVASVELPDHSSSSVTLAGDYVYVALVDCYYFTCSGSLQVIDISDPTQSRLVSSLDVPGGAFAVTMTSDANSSGRYVYLAAGDVGVWVADASDPAQPHLVGLANTPGRARSIAVMGDLAYVGDEHGGLLILHVVEAP
jgi:hypothetical protein